jgi:hypothetical protein
VGHDDSQAYLLVTLITIRTVHAGEPLLEYNGSQSETEGTHDRSSVIGLTAAGERVHARADDFGLSAVVQWSSPVECVRE